MKIPNLENKRKVIYVQLKDLIAAISIEKNIPDEVKLEIENKINPNLEESTFIKLEQPKTVDFFNSTDWILNYKSFVKSQPHEIEFQYMITHQRLSLFGSSLNITPDDNSTKREYKISNHKMNDIKQAIQSIVYNNVDIPLIEDSDAPKFYMEHHQDYKIQSSLNPNIFLIRKLNRTSTSLDAIDYNELKDFISLIKKEECEINLSINLNDTSTMICVLTPVPVKQEDNPTQKRRFFKRKKSHNTK